MAPYWRPVQFKTIWRPYGTPLQSLKKHQRALKPVEPGRLCAQDGNPTGFKGWYSGLFTRHLKNGKREWLSARLQLRRSRNRVHGRFFFGAGEGILQDVVVQGSRLVFDWQWGTATGTGSLEASKAGGLKGLWGYGPDSEGGGTWDLCPEGEHRPATHEFDTGKRGS